MERVLLVGLLQKLESLVSEKPAPLEVGEAPGVVVAPVSGTTVPLEGVGDPVFARGMLGCGVGIRPAGELAYAPVSGVVAADVKTRHALLLRSDDGLEVLLHVGLDSVMLSGAGFLPYVRKGDHVRAGQPVLGFSRSLMAERGLDDTVVVTVTNSDAFSSVKVTCGEKISAGSELIRCAR